MKFQLLRTYMNKEVTLGVILLKHKPFLFTLELPWKGNEKNISCIPDGDYKCQRYISRKFGETFIVKNVFGRSGILFHAGNTVKDTEGCFLVGESAGSDYSVLESRRAMGRLMKELEGVDNFDLKIESLIV